MLTPDTFRSKFEQGLTYRDYVAGGTPSQQTDWAAFRARVSLTDAQTRLIASFNRRIHALCLSGLWCGDCVQQCPMFDAIAAANTERIHLRFLDRDEHKDLSEQVKICGGLRVPTLILLNEDFEFVSILGDRSLSRYRAIAARQLGPSCPLPGAPVPPDEIAATLGDWVNEFERASLMLRLSPKLRQRHGD